MPSRSEVAPNRSPHSPDPRRRRSPRRSYAEKLRDPRWQKKRLEVLERAGWTCENEQCESPPETPLHVHHGYYESGRDPWDYPDETLWCLCEECHAWAEEARRDCYLELARINPCSLAPAMIFRLRRGADEKRLERLAPQSAHAARRWRERVRRIGGFGQ